MPEPWNAERGEQEILTFVKSYSETRKTAPSQYDHLMDCYCEMATGGAGGPSDTEPTQDGPLSSFRDQYYHGYPDDWFFCILSGLGELDRYYSYLESKSRGDN